MTVANTPGTLPSPNSIRAGMRYTRLGIVCMASKMGVITALIRSEPDMAIPTGIPITKEISTAMITIPRVSMATSHSPNIPIVRISIPGSNVLNQL